MGYPEAGLHAGFEAGRYPVGVGQQLLRANGWRHGHQPEHARV